MNLILHDKEYNKYLVIVVTKCGINEVDLYLRLNWIELKREFLERQYNLLVYEDAFIPYQVSLEKGYDYQDFNGVLFYYTYATKTEVENFKITDGFHLSYEEKEKIKSNKHQNISLNWISPFSRKSNIGNPEFFIFEDTTFIIGINVPKATHIKQFIQ